jgi:Protein of unknown function (DUF3489)
MPRLTKSQLLILSAAALRSDGAAVPPPKLRGRALKRALLPLLKQGYVREAKATKKMPSWRLDRASGRVALVLTPQGREAVSAKAEERGPRHPLLVRGSAIGRAAIPRSPRAYRSRAIPAPVIGRGESKLVRVLRLISRRSGATLDELVDATGWLPHSIRAALSTLRKRGHIIERSRGRQGRSVYRRSGPSRNDQTARGAHE